MPQSHPPSVSARGATAPSRLHRAVLETMRGRRTPRRSTPPTAATVPAVALTFDDGPDPEWTPALLTALRRANATATFFVIAPRAAAAPALIERMRRDGHRVELHCFAHRRHSEMTEDEVERDVVRALAALDAVGVWPHLWRTPWGAQAPFTAAVAARHDLRLVGWDADTHDWRGDSAKAMRDALARDLPSAGVVLAHDGIGPGARREDCRETVALVRAIGVEARRRRWRLTALNNEGRPA